ncbi:uncharacterized protein LOC113940552 isoform X2 [Corapipo altera]|nr:uncharacterized protein LOC113940552 isoform X2 [Corapipo altera]
MGSIPRLEMGSIPRLCIPHQGWDRSRGCASLTRDGIDPEAVHPSPGMGSIPRLCIPHWRWDGIDPEAVHPSLEMGWDRSRGCASLTRAGINPKVVHPSPGLAELPSQLRGWLRGLCPPGHLSPQAQGKKRAAGAVLVELRDRSQRARRRDIRNPGWSRELGWSSGDTPVPPRARAQPSPSACPSCPMVALEVLAVRTRDTVPQQPPREPWGWARARPCPSLPVEGSHSSNTLLRSPTQRGRRLDGPGGGLTGSLAWWELSPRASGSSAYSLWIGDPRGRSLSCCVSSGRALSRRIQAGKSRLSQLPVCETPH